MSDWPDELVELTSWPSELVNLLEPQEAIHEHWLDEPPSRDMPGPRCVYGMPETRCVHRASDGNFTCSMHWAWQTFPNGRAVVYGILSTLYERDDIQFWTDPEFDELGRWLLENPPTEADWLPLEDLGAATGRKWASFPSWIHDLASERVT